MCTFSPASLPHLPPVCASPFMFPPTLFFLTQEAFSRMDAEILDKSRASGRFDGTTALAAVHVGPVLSVANAGEGSGG